MDKDVRDFKKANPGAYRRTRSYPQRRPAWLRDKTVAVTEFHNLLPEGHSEIKGDVPGQYLRGASPDEQRRIILAYQSKYFHFNEPGRDGPVRQIVRDGKPVAPGIDPWVDVLASWGTGSKR